ncbi:MAG TPA: thioesterase domain-containing protein [Pseudonocardiaceae bacterium]
MTEHHEHTPVRLFCLPYAGGSARVFAGWGRHLPPWIDVVPLELPGRGSRFDEPVSDDVADVVAGLRDAALSRLDRPYAVFGHSLGALLGFELIVALQRCGHPALHFFASGAGAPHLPTRNPAPRFDDHRLRTHIAELGGTPPELLANDELMELMLPVLRADFTIADTYRPPSGALLDCPTTAFCGDEDGEAPAADVLAWRRHVRTSCTIRLLAGGHFFVHSAQDVLLSLIVSALCPRCARPIQTLPRRGVTTS